MLPSSSLEQKFIDQDTHLNYESREYFREGKKRYCILLKIKYMEMCIIHTYTHGEIQTCRYYIYSMHFPGRRLVSSVRLWLNVTIRF